MFNIYIKKAINLYGVPKTRQIYEKAIEELDVDGSRQMCLRFAELETKLGEIDRARAIYAHCSQMCDPRVSIDRSMSDRVYLLDNQRISIECGILQVTNDFWETWTNFEACHGNEDSLREMLRIKRSVQALYNTQVS